jgi:demethylmenaquinone methyltransferase/2-methoxy-6-polyprenyl-1,4-benzoquinol methylase
VTVQLPPAEEKPVYVNRMFARIAPTYNAMNRIISGGQDRRWRDELLDLCELPPHGRLLDVGAGTGDIAYAARRHFPASTVVGVDFTYEMMAAGQSRAAQARTRFVQGDTFALPFADNTFDAVVSGFLVRNVVDCVAAFCEQTRVTRPGGRVVCLETAPPQNTVLGSLFEFYFFQIVPLVGGLLSGDREAYTYLPHSTVGFPAPQELARAMEQANLRNVFYRERMFGTVAIHVGVK